MPDLSDTEAERDLGPVPWETRFSRWLRAEGWALIAAGVALVISVALLLVLARG